MNFSDLLKRVSKLAADNSPAILTAIGVTGAVTTAYLTGRASFRAAHILRNKELYFEAELELNMDLKDKIGFTWKLYIPPVAAGCLTVVSIIGANQISTRRAVAMASAYSLLERASEQYQQKVVERIGKTKELAIRDEIAQDRVTANPPVSKEVIITGNGTVLCKDDYSGRYFESSVEDIKGAQNDLNYRIISDNYASLNDFYNLIGLPSVTHGDDVGWNLGKKLELTFSTTLTENQLPCIVIGFNVTPVREFYKIH